MFVSIGNSRMDKKFNCTDMTYEDFVSRLSKTKYTAETMEQYRKMPKGQQDKYQGCRRIRPWKAEGRTQEEGLRDLQICHHA